MAEERSRLRLTFNEDALLYDRVRPGYPSAMLDDIVALSGIPAGGRILEIGPGTGPGYPPMGAAWLPCRRGRVGREHGGARAR